MSAEVRVPPSCNLHDDCDAADAAVQEFYSQMAYHCYLPNCEGCDGH